MPHAQENSVTLDTGKQTRAAGAIGGQAGCSRTSLPWRAEALRPLPGLALLLFGTLMAGAGDMPTHALPLAADALEQALRIHGLPVVSHPGHPPESNLPSGAGDALARDPQTGLLPEAAPYTQLEAPFDPFSDQAPRMDLVTWNPAWISERLAEPALRAEWPGLQGVDEISRAANIRASGINAAEKVWLRHWYEPTHLDLDLNADGRLTDADSDGRPDAPVNPLPSSIDEWFPAIMSELSYLLIENEPLPVAAPLPSDAHRSAPRPTCGRAGSTSFVFPVGTAIEETEEGGIARGHGLTSLDADFDGQMDQLRVSDESDLVGRLNGLRLDFDGDGVLDSLDPDGSPLSCDEQIVLHTETLKLAVGEKAQLLDHFVSLERAGESSASLTVWYHGDLQPRRIQSHSLGIGGALLAGDTGPLLAIPPGGDSLGQVPPGAWFVYLVDVDAERGIAQVILGRALGAPCAALQAAPRQAKLAAGGPWFLKRFYVDGHAYDLVSIGTCPDGGLQYLTIRAVIPKVAVRIEQHSVRLQDYAIPPDGSLPWLPLPPPFNHEHTRLEDVKALDGFDDLIPRAGAAIDRPRLPYMGGPIGPIPPLLPGPDALPYQGRIGATTRAYDDPRASRWTYVSETTDPDQSGQQREIPVPPTAPPPGSPFAPGLSLEKAVYLGHDSGASCPGLNRIQGLPESPITYCFLLTNTGQTWLIDPRIEDPALGLDESDLSLGGGSFPLAPGETAFWYYETALMDDLINVARATARPSDPNGTPIPNAPRPGDEDDAEVDTFLFDFGDAPTALGYASLLADGGASHRLLINGPMIGRCVDAEEDGQPDSAALGDDRDGVCDDEDGIVFLSTLHPRLSSELRISTEGSNRDGLLSAWIDFNRDGDWDDPGERILTDRRILAGRESGPSFYFEVPEEALPGETFLRLRVSSQAGLGPTGPAPDGEVEDHRIAIQPSACPFAAIDSFGSVGDSELATGIMLSADRPGPVTVDDRPSDPTDVLGGLRHVEFGPFQGGTAGPPIHTVFLRVSPGRMDHVGNPESRAPLLLRYDAGGAGLGLDLSDLESLRIYYLFEDAGTAESIPLTLDLIQGVGRVSLTRPVLRGIHPFFVDFPLAAFPGIEALDLTDIDGLELRFATSFAQDFILDEIVPCPTTGDLSPSPGRGADASAIDTPGDSESSPTSPADSLPESLEQDRPLSLNQADSGPRRSFYNEQILGLPRHYTEFLMPDLPEAGGMDPDRYHVTSALLAPEARWRRWLMPDRALPAEIPPPPPDLIEDQSAPPGASRRAAFWFEPDLVEPAALWIGEAGARLHGGQPETPGLDACDSNRPSLLAGAGDLTARDPQDPARIVESPPYTDPWAPFHPRHPDAPRADSITVNPAYMDAFRHHGEPLAALYGQISADGRPAREKVYHRLWYEPAHIASAPRSQDCSADLVFPALMQEYSFLLLDSNDRPTTTLAGQGRMAFPMAARAEDLPLPRIGGQLPAGGTVGRGIGSFDLNFDGQDEVLSIHSERSLAATLDASWQALRLNLPGPPPPSPGPILDLDGDGALDDLDPDGIPQSGDELLILVAEDVSLELDPDSETAASAMLLDYMVSLESVTRGQRARLQLWYTGESRPSPRGGPLALELGQALIVDRFQDKSTQVGPGQQNPGVDGAWFLYLSAVSGDRDRVVLTIGRALGATHSAMGDGAGGPDLLAGDPWYLKRFFVEGQSYDLVALEIWPEILEDRFASLTLRTALPLVPVFDPQHTLRLSDYPADGRPVPMLPPFDRDHTMAVDIERQPAEDFGHTRRYDDCVGPLAPFGPLEESLQGQGVEARYRVSLAEIYRQNVEQLGGATWLLDQHQSSPDQRLDVRLSGGQTYLYTSNWRSPVARIHAYGCPVDAGSDQPWMVALDHDTLADIALLWGLPPAFLPRANELDPPQPTDPVLDGGPELYAPWYDARLGRYSLRMQRFFDPAEPPSDYYVNRVAAVGIPPQPEISPTPVPTRRPSPTPVPTDLPFAFALRARLLPELPQQIELAWNPPADGRAVELAVSIGGSAYESLNPGGGPLPGSGGGFGLASEASAASDSASSKLPSVARTTGLLAPGLYRSPALPAGLSLRFRARLASTRGRQAGAWSDATAALQLPEALPGDTACLEGRLTLQGRRLFSGGWLRLSGFPVAPADATGRFGICGAPTGPVEPSASAPGYLARALQLSLRPGQRSSLASADLAGGDVNSNARVDLFDLVRIGAAFQQLPISDPEADLNQDGRVDLFDLVLVGRNYGLAGPLPWGLAGGPAADGGLVAGGGPADSGLDAAGSIAEFGSSGPPMIVREGDRPLQEPASLLERELRVLDAGALYGVDFRLSWDPARLAPIDASTAAAGLQIDPGPLWSDAPSFIARNAVEAEPGPEGWPRLRFAASLMQPASPAAGEVLVARLAFEILDPEASLAGAFRLESIELSDPEGQPLPARWDGEAIRLAGPLHLPLLGRMAR
jgi:hypothetical protein